MWITLFTYVGVCQCLRYKRGLTGSLKGTGRSPNAEMALKAIRFLRCSYAGPISVEPLFSKPDQVPEAVWEAVYDATLDLQVQAKQ